MGPSASVDTGAAAGSSSSSRAPPPPQGREQQLGEFLYSASHPKHPIVWNEKAKASCFARRPVVVFWDVSAERVDEFAAVLGQFLREHRPHNLMVSGPLETTLPGVERLGAEVLLRALGLGADF